MDFNSGWGYRGHECIGIAVCSGVEACIVVSADPFDFVADWSAATAGVQRESTAVCNIVWLGVVVLCAAWYALLPTLRSGPPACPLHMSSLLWSNQNRPKTAKHDPKPLMVRA